MIRTTITIDESVYKRLVEKAKDERRSVSNYIGCVVEKSVKDHDKKPE